MGTINRAQQGFHFEKQNFAPTLAAADLAANNVLGVVVSSNYYSFATTAGANNTEAAATATPLAAQADGVRPYSNGINFDTATGQYATVVCQTDQITSVAVAHVSGSTACGTGATLIK